MQYETRRMLMCDWAYWEPTPYVEYQHTYICVVIVHAVSNETKNRDAIYVSCGRPRAIHVLCVRMMHVKQQLFRVRLSECVSPAARAFKFLHIFQHFQFYV